MSLGGLFGSDELIPGGLDLDRNLESDKKIGVKIKALEKGSFLIHIKLVETPLKAIRNIFTGENVEIAESIIVSLCGLFKLVKFLKGKKA